jgi:hypothetical protein
VRRTGAVSGGTVASALNVFANGLGAVRRMSDLYVLADGKPTRDRRQHDVVRTD